MRNIKKTITLLIFAGALTGLTAAETRPNIVFIFSDDHTSQAIGAYNGPLAKLNPTPHIDLLAMQGMRFDRFYVGNSICAPSRATLLTGKHSHLHGKKDNRGGFNHNQQTFPKLLQQAGYQTAIFGKTHLAGKIQGFDDWETLPGQGSYYQPDFDTKDGVKNYQGYVTDIITDKAVDWLKNKGDNEKPFMLMVHHKGTHRTWCPAIRHVNAFDDVEIPTPENFIDTYENRDAARKQAMTIAGCMNMQNDLKVKDQNYKEKMTRKYSGSKRLPGGEKGAYFRMTAEQKKAWDDAYDPKNQKFWESNLKGRDLLNWKYQRYMKDYLRTALSIDEGVGRILDTLKELGLDKNTIVMYSSDQGFYLGEHGWFDKRFMYEESFRTPMLVKWPGKIKPGSVNNELCQNIDFAPTFLALAQASIPDDMQGRSLVPLLKEVKDRDWRTSLYYHYYEFPGGHNVRRHEGIATKEYKLIQFYGHGVPDSEQWEFYVRKTDPMEMNNLYGNPEYAATIDKLKSDLAGLRVKYKVQK